MTFDRRLARGSAERLRDKRRELSALEVPFGRGWEPAQEPVAEIVCEPPAGIGAVITKLEALQSILDDLPPGRAANRVAAFNDLYLTITRRVEGRCAPTPPIRSSSNCSTWSSPRGTSTRWTGGTATTRPRRTSGRCCSSAPGTCG
jgi:hypothetical protein